MPVFILQLNKMQYLHDILFLLFLFTISPSCAFIVIVSTLISDGFISLCLITQSLPQLRTIFSSYELYISSQWHQFPTGLTCDPVILLLIFSRLRYKNGRGIWLDQLSNQTGCSATPTTSCWHRSLRIDISLLCCPSSRLTHELTTLTVMWPESPPSS